MEVFEHGPFEGAGEGVAGAPQQGRMVRGDAGGELLGPGQQLVPGQHFGDRAPVERLSRGELLAGEEWGSPGWVDTARMGVRALKEPDGYEETVQRGVQTRRG